MTDGTPINRRKLISAGIGTLGLLSGCVSIEINSGTDPPTSTTGMGPTSTQEYDPDTDIKTLDDEEDSTTVEPASEELLSVQRTEVIEEGHWYYHTFSVPASGATLSYSFEVTRGPQIESLLMDKVDYAYYKEGEEYSYYPSASRFNRRETTVQNISLDQGTYRLVIDNSEYGETSPPTDFDNNIATVSYSINVEA